MWCTNRGAVHERLIELLSLSCSSSIKTCWNSTAAFTPPRVPYFPQLWTPTISCEGGQFVGVYLAPYRVIITPHALGARGEVQGGGASEVGCWVLGQTRLAWLVSESGAPARNSALSCPLRLAELNREGRSAASISRRAAQVDRS